MFDHGGTCGASQPSLIWQNQQTRLAADPLGSSDRHCWLMRRDLQGNHPSIAPASQQVRQGFAPEDAMQIHQLLILGYQNGGGSVTDYPTWLRALHTDPEFDPSLCFTASDESGLVGVMHCWTSAFIKDLVVHPRARRQGTALALLNHGFHTFGLRGEGWVDLKVMENNLDARRLYEKAGMRYVQRSAMIESDLA
ncbi:GNAT family N-acetyltransferase [Pseudomonas sp. G.S.17]|uniref:GNAT family N-acetyltransferase n=1 Tax=Pseudomonas sp. G.S.17 TaxID=3137451 RepID=UPI00311C9A0C